MSDILSSIKSTISTNKKFKVVFYGDSSTSTEWVHPNWREIVEYVLKVELEDFQPTPVGTGSWNYSWWNLNFINSGLNGATTSDFLRRLDMDVLSYNPDMVIAITGDNDVGKISEKEHADNHKRILDILTSKVKHICYATSIYTANEYHNQRYQQYVNELKNIFPVENVKFIDLFNELSSFPTNRFFTYKIDNENEKFLADEQGGDIDTYHPNSLGNAYIAKILLKEIFEIKFDPEMYISDVYSGIKYPKYK